MRAELTAIVRRCDEGFVAICAEVPGAEVVSATECGALASLIEAIGIVFEVNRDDAFSEAGSNGKLHRIVVDLKASDDGGLLEIDGYAP